MPDSCPKIGLFGGSFDPVHIGHVKLAKIACDKFGLTKVVFLPVSKNPLKKSNPFASTADRLQMLRLAVAKDPRLEISDLDCKKDGEPAFTIDLVRSYLDQFDQKKPEIFFLLGADNLASFHQWKEYQNLISLCNFILFGRVSAQHQDPAALYSNLSEQEVHKLFANLVPFNEPVSSTLIRAAIKNGRSEAIAPFIDPAVLDYIAKNNPYSF